jgi:hypothetical protein
LQLYSVTVVYGGVRKDTTEVTQPFHKESGEDVGCEQGGSTSVSYTLPANASEINCSAGWINTNKLKSQTQTACTVTGQTASASGSVFGVDKQCIPGSGFFGGGGICNCPGGGHGWLQIAGTYKLPANPRRIAGRRSGFFCQIY